ncbi:MAG: plasmid stabilization protein [Desulfobacterium sp.]|nr:plasmid stabilization protein [Desulfobacterium sp.]
MKYDIQFKPRAVKDIKKISSHMQTKIIKSIEMMCENLDGDVKRLTNFTPEYRLRVGDYRVVFEIENKSIIIYRVRHRREVYR